MKELLLGDETAMMLGSYAATRAAAQCYLEFLPQLALQCWIIFGGNKGESGFHELNITAIGTHEPTRCIDDPTCGEDAKAAVYWAFAVSMISLMYNIVINWMEMKRLHMKPCAYFLMLIEVGGGKVGNIAKAIGNNDLKYEGEVDLRALGVRYVSDAHARMLLEALKQNTTVPVESAAEHTPAH